MLPSSPSSSVYSEPQPIDTDLYLETQAGKTLIDTLTAFAEAGKINFYELDKIPSAFSACMRSVVAERSQIKVRVRGKLSEFRELPEGSEWKCGTSTVVIAPGERKDGLRLIRPGINDSMVRGMQGGLGCLEAGEVFVKAEP